MRGEKTELTGVIESLEKQGGGKVNEAGKNRWRLHNNRAVKIRHAKRSFRDKEMKYRAIIENTRDAVFIMDEQKVLECNAYALKMYGCTKEELLEASFFDVFSPLFQPDGQKSKEKAACKIEAALDDKPQRFEWAHCKLNGELFWAEVSLRALESGRGKLLASIVRDITLQKQAEEDVVFQRAYFQQLFENSPEGIAILDKKERIVAVNEGFQEIFQYGLNEIKGKYINDVIVPGYLAGEASTLTQAVQQQKYVRTETKRKRKDGTTVHVALLGFPVIINKRPEGVIAVYKDVTDKKKAEEELQQNYEKLRKSMESTILAMSKIMEVRDAYTAGHQQRVAKLACKIAEEMGLSKERVESIRVAGILHDIGKIYIPSDILNRPNKLLEDEFRIVMTHPKVAYDILKDVEFPWAVAKIVLQHHERINGSGYPVGLTGDEILLEAKILGVADVVEAMSHHRPYRPALGVEKALEEIEYNKGILYDPAVAGACAKLFASGGFSFEEIL